MLETPGSLRGDAAFDALLPIINSPSISLGNIVDVASNISFTWEKPPASAHMSGISVLVNDGERLRRFFTQDITLEGNPDDMFMWTRDADLGLPEYIRFAFIRDGVTLNYTKAGTWFANGTWAMPSV